jgi:protein ImuA
VGLHPARLLLAHAKAESDVLALMEEGLRHSALSCVIGEIAKLDLTASRRLQLAGEKSGVMALVLRKPGSDQSIPITCASRWRVGPFPSAPHVIPQAGRARWRLELLRARSGHSGCWIVEAPDAKGDLGFSGQLADRGADTPRAKFSLAG